MCPTYEAPASLAAGPGRDCLPERAGIPTIQQVGNRRHTLIYRLALPSGVASITAPPGRATWLLDRLIEAGMKGLTAADLPAGLRLAAYVQRLRRAGVPITTSFEPNSGAWGGSHGRYRLDCRAEREGESADPYRGEVFRSG
jgi:hypothetical protein